MEPQIPDGSFCVFRRNVVGSRNGRLVLVRNSELADSELRLQAPLGHQVARGLLLAPEVR